MPGLDPQKNPVQYVLNTWKIERGLPNNSVIALAQDRDGYLWLGTPNGLVRFDGADFEVFNRDSHAEFRDDFINDLLVDRGGTLWIACYGGRLLSREQGKFSEHFLASMVSGIANHSLAEDRFGNIWVGTYDGLFCRPPGGDRPFKEVAEFAGKKILCLLEDSSGVFWVATQNDGIYRREPDRWRLIVPIRGVVTREINVLYQGRSGCLWIGTDEGVAVYKDGKIVPRAIRLEMEATVNSLLEDRNGNLWMACDSGLHCVQGGRQESLVKIPGLGSDYVYSLCEDSEGSLWAGTVDGGLTQIRDKKLATYPGREGPGGDLVRCLHGDGADGLWIGGNAGLLSHRRPDRSQGFVLPPAFRKSIIWSIEADGPDALWLGTSRGLLRFLRAAFRPVPLPGPAGDTDVRCVLKDGQGRLWAALWGRGLACRRSDGEFRLYTKRDGLPDDYVSCLYGGRLGDLWIGSENGASIARSDGRGGVRFENMLPGCQVVAFHEDGAGTMWVGTRNHGLKVKRDGRWGSLSSRQGLFDKRAYTILEDDLGNLWLSSERGLFCANKEELAQAAFDEGRHVRGRLFDENDGMKSRICNNGNPAGWKDGGGGLWFANLAGVVSIDPARIRTNERVPPVLVEEVGVDNQELPVQGTSLKAPLKLAAGSKRFEFKYTALSFIRSDKIAFKYKLEGYDRDWTEAGSRRQAFYTNLRPGRYRFRVIAANADGVWNTAGASFAFYLSPFVYQTWWFLALSALAFGAVSAFSWQLLRKYLKAVSFWKKRTQIAHFKILETIGSGGMATVYRAQDLLNRRRVVALKVLSEENFHDEAQRKRFQHESLIAERLDHPHIVRIYERGELEDCWYIAMELLAGVSLARLIKEKGRLATGEALDIMTQVIDALGAIHALNIVHRDLKPENIMVSEGGGPVDAGRNGPVGAGRNGPVGAGRNGRRYFIKLLDFGLAITPAQSRLTMSGVVMGTIRYLPPERIHQGVSSAAGDIYSAGIILYEMLTAAKPFWSEATGEVIHRILETYPLSARELNPQVPAELDALIQAMIDKDPGRRPALAAIAATLRRLAESLPPSS